MKNENRDLLGFNVPVVGIVETLGEAISAAGSEAAVLKDYVSNVLAHSHYTVLRNTIVKTLETNTGIKRLTKKVKEKDVIAEKDAEYIARLETELGEEVLKSHGDAVAAACAKIPVDYTPGTRGNGGATAVPAKKWLAYYDQLVAEEKLDAFVAKHSLALDGLDEDGVKYLVANKVRELVTAKLAAAAAEATSV